MVNKTFCNSRQPEPLHTLLHSNGRSLQVQSGVKRFFDILDAEIDEVTRKKLLEENGRAWYGHLHTMPEEVMELGEFIKQVQRDIGKENCRLDGNIVFLKKQIIPVKIRKHLKLKKENQERFILIH